MHLIDWLLIACPLLLVFAVGFMTQRHMKSVAHFVSGGRLGGRYLLAVARGEMQAGAVVFVAAWEVFARAGFVPHWWGCMAAPVGVALAVSGFVIYRFRETRCMTLAEFFERRYSHRFRLFTGVLGFLAGILNFGIIPAIGARFVVYFLQIPPELHFGTWSLPTYVPLMGLFLCISLTLTLTGGLITLMVTDCLEGIISQLFYLLIIGGVFFVIGWAHMEPVISGRPAGFSLINPFDAWKVQDINLWYALMSMMLNVYGVMAWQNASAYNSAAASPHESLMGGILGRWRESGKAVVVVLLAAAAISFLQNPDFSAAAAPAHAALAQIENAQLRTQMEVPVALSYLLPIGIKGALCAILIMGIFGGDSTHLHSWGGILAQDVILPLLKKAPSPKNHIRLLRGCSTFVAVFAFVFGIIFTQTEFIVMWWSITTAIYVGGAGAAIIGGLYWKKGTAAGAWTALLIGVVCSGGGIILSKTIPNFPLNGVQVSFFTTLLAVTGYVGVSLLTCRHPHDIAAMLHRESPSTPLRARLTWARLVGFNENFSRSDRWITGTFFGWNVMWFSVFLIGTTWNVIAPWPNHVWSAYWHVVGVGVPIGLCIITGIWFTWGGLHDIRALFKALKSYEVDNSDNGRVARPPSVATGAPDVIAPAPLVLSDPNLRS